MPLLEELRCPSNQEDALCQIEVIGVVAVIDSTSPTISWQESLKAPIPRPASQTMVAGVESI